MKKIVYLCIAIIHTCIATAQSTQINHDKYWFYRYRLRNEFLQMGEATCGDSINSGYSIPAASKYVNNPNNSFNAVTDWGDATVDLGYYISVLATEFQLLKNAGKPTEHIKQELYYALKAYERVDRNAEVLQYPSYPTYTDCDESFNGFFIRDDVSSYFIAKHDEKFGLGISLDNLLQKNNPERIKFEREHVWSGLISKRKALNMRNTASGDPHPFPSQDQISALFMGFGLVVKCLGNETYNGQSLKGLAKEYTRKIIEYIGKDDLFWQIKHPVTDELVYYGNEQSTAYGLAQAARVILSEDWADKKQGIQDAFNVSPYEDVWTSLTFDFWQGLQYPAGNNIFYANYNNVPYWKVSITPLGVKVLPPNSPLPDITIGAVADAHDYNNRFLGEIGAISNSWKLGLVSKRKSINIPVPWLCIEADRYCCFPSPRYCFGRYVCGVEIVECTKDIEFVYYCYDNTLDGNISNYIQDNLGYAAAKNAVESVIGSLGVNICTPFQLPEFAVNTTGYSLSKYGELYHLEMQALLHRFLHNKGDYVYSLSHMINLLNNAPCAMPHYKPFNDPYINASSTGNPGWQVQSNFSKTNPSRIGESYGTFNGLDYMLMYNLYSLVHGTPGTVYTDMVNNIETDKVYPLASSYASYSSPHLAKSFENLLASNITINNGPSNPQKGHVTYLASKSVKLTNLRVKNGSYFKAAIENASPPCSNYGMNSSESTPLPPPENVENTIIEEEPLSTTAYLEAVNKIKQASRYIPLQEYLIEKNPSLKSDNIAFFLYPNPSKEVVHLNLSSTLTDEIEYSVIDQQGIRHLSGNVSIVKGQNDVSIPVSTLSAGLYLITVKSRLSVLTKSFSISN